MRKAAYARSRPEEIKVITIRDPVAGVSYRLDPVRKSDVEDRNRRYSDRVGRGRCGGRSSIAPQTPAQEDIRVAVQRLAGQATRSDPDDIVPDLGTTMLNGVPASGTRTTTVVRGGPMALVEDIATRPVYCGADRFLKPERWFTARAIHRRQPCPTAARKIARPERGLS